jgi:hypothetical protein
MSEEFLQNSISLNMLRTSVSGGIFEEKIKREQQKRLQFLLKHAPFLAEDEERRKRWIRSIPKLNIEFLKKMIDAVLRENLRFKKRERNLVLELNKKQAHISFA